MWLTADTCHVNDTKHISDLSIVGSSITFLLCILYNMSFGANVGASAAQQNQLKNLIFTPVLKK